MLTDGNAMDLTCTCVIYAMSNEVQFGQKTITKRSIDLIKTISMWSTRILGKTTRILDKTSMNQTYDLWSMWYCIQQGMKK